MLISILVTSDEDIWAVKTLNLLGAIDSLLKVLVLLKNCAQALQNTDGSFTLPKNKTKTDSTENPMEISLHNGVRDRFVCVFVCQRMSFIRTCNVLS